MISQGDPNAQLVLVVTVAQLDFMTTRMTAGTMTFQEAKLTNELLELFVAQANNKELQALKDPPAPPPAPAPAPATSNKAEEGSSGNG